MCKQTWFYLCEQTLECTSHNSWLVACVLTLGGWYATGGGWKFMLTKNWANQMC